MDYKIGDRVGKFYDNVIEKAIIIDIQHGLYLLKFDNNDYENLLCDDEKIFKIDEEKSLLDKIINTDFLEDMCSEETANEYKKLIKEEIEEIKQKAFEDGQTSIIERYISKDKLKKKLEWYEFLQNDEVIKFPDRFTDKYFVYDEVIKVLKELLNN